MQEGPGHAGVGQLWSVCSLDVLLDPAPPSCPAALTGSVDRKGTESVSGTPSQGYFIFMLWEPAQFTVLLPPGHCDLQSIPALWSVCWHQGHSSRAMGPNTTEDSPLLPVPNLLEPLQQSCDIPEMC